MSPAWVRWFSDQPVDEGSLTGDALFPDGVPSVASDEHGFFGDSPGFDPHQVEESPAFGDTSMPPPESQDSGALSLFSDPVAPPDESLPFSDPHRLPDDDLFGAFIPAERDWTAAAVRRYMVQADIAAFVATLTVNDANLEIGVTDYKHVLRWSGTALDFLEGDSSGYTVEGKPAGTAPNGGLWGICDGSTYAVLNGDGTTTNIVTRNRTDDSFVIGTAPGSVGVRVATSPTWITGAQTETEATGITIDDHDDHDINTLGDHGSGTDSIVSSATHGAHGVNDPEHFHILTNGNASMNPPDEVEGGLPARVAVVFFIRR